MSVLDSMKEEMEAMPAQLRVLLEAELAAGNEVVEIGHSFPAPPTGTFFKLAKPLLSREKKSGGGIDYRARNSSLYSGEITDAARQYFLIEPPATDMTRSENIGGAVTSIETLPTGSASAITSDAQTRFQASTVIEYDKWHDGVGYDLDALHELSATEKQSIEVGLIARGVNDWRDIEALANLKTPAAVAAIQSAINHPNPEVTLAITRCAPALISESQRTDILIKQLESATFFAGLGQALDQVAEFHPPRVIETLLRGVLDRPGDVAVHFAAMLCYVHGQALEPFDMDQRDFFLRFNTEVESERECAFRDLCEKIKIDRMTYPKNAKTSVTDASVSIDSDYAVEVDVRGEMLTYCEPNRSAHVICTFHSVPCVVTRTLSNWYYPLGRRSEKMNPEEKGFVLNRIADYCRKHHAMPKLAFE